jgi:hypothetical protein
MTGQHYRMIMVGSLVVGQYAVLSVTMDVELAIRSCFLAAPLLVSDSRGAEWLYSMGCDSSTPFRRTLARGQVLMNASSTGEPIPVKNPETSTVAHEINAIKNELLTVRTSGVMD